MIRRPAVTLMEVLIAMFIMAIGMLAMLALFPVGAVSMAQALKDDRCAYAASMAENVAIVTNVRYQDAYVNAALTSSPSGLVYVDPSGVLAMPTTAPYGTSLGGVILRVAPSFVYPPPPTLPLPLPGALPSSFLNDRWYSLPDDIGFNQSGTPDTSNTGGVIDRGRRYSYAYLLRRQTPYSVDPSPSVPVQLYAVVYSGRPINSLTLETTYTAATVGLPQLGTVGTNFVTLPAATSVKRGGWILDPINGYFYRVTNLAEAGTLMTVELQQNLVGLPGGLPGGTISQITVMDHAAEIFDKGYGWQQ